MIVNAFDMDYERHFAWPGGITDITRYERGSTAGGK